MGAGGNQLVKIDLRQSVIDQSGKPYTEREADPNSPRGFVERVKPLREFLYVVLEQAAQGETLTTEDKVRMGRLQMQLFASHKIDLSASDVDFIVGRVQKLYLSPLLVVRLTDILEGRKPEKILPEEDLKAVSGSSSEESE
jgi:hypothetical protein